MSEHQFVTVPRSRSAGTERQEVAEAASATCKTRHPTALPTAGQSIHTQRRARRSEGSAFCRQSEAGIPTTSTRGKHASGFRLRMP